MPMCYKLLKKYHFSGEICSGGITLSAPLVNQALSVIPRLPKHVPNLLTQICLSLFINNNFPIWPNWFIHHSFPENTLQLELERWEQKWKEVGKYATDGLDERGERKEQITAVSQVWSERPNEWSSYLFTYMREGAVQKNPILDMLNLRSLLAIQVEVSHRQSFKIMDSVKVT